MMRDFANKLLQDENSHRPDGIFSYVMDKLHVACLKRLALKGKEYNKEAKKLILKNLTLEQNNADFESRLKALTEENRRLRQQL